MKKKDKRVIYDFFIIIPEKKAIIKQKNDNIEK